MQWSEMYTIDNSPGIKEISNYINNPLFNQLCSYIEKTYSVLPLIEYSKCSMARGWNIKYKKGSKALCTLYPNQNYFTCMVVLSTNEVMETEFLLAHLDPYIQELYQTSKPFNGSRWLMINVTNNTIFDDVKKLIQIRIKPKKL